MGYGNNKLSIIGLGYVGLPLAAEFAKNGVNTVGIDVDDSKIKKINKGESYISDISSEDLSAVVTKGTLTATTDISAVKDTDSIIICVPTPVTVHKTPDVSFIQSVVDGIAPYLRKGHLVILRSTTYPGSTREFIVPKMEAAGIEIGTDGHVAFAPERVDPGSEKYNFKNTPIVLGGVTKKCTEEASNLLLMVTNDVIKVSSPEVAEMAKLLENIFRSVNIAMINEMAMLCDRIGGIDIWEVVRAASTKPFGFMKFNPGPGIGGHCIQIDPYYLSWKAKEYNFYSDFIEQAAKTNENMPRYVADMTIQALSMSSTPLPNCKVLIIGVAYKPDIDDLRNSPGIHVWEALLEKGVNSIEYSDPFVPAFKEGALESKSLDLNEDMLKEYECVVIITDHSTIDWQMVFDNSKFIVDTRNASERVNTGASKYYSLGGGQLGKNGTYRK
ncbi:MAG: nucleotide sugar dehydrogenase [Candidatus Marinimicrobia bacterium]|nr:nucleotide sugar dehydrogenase [Candidatus Neomarinimicrobiota bacterium]